MIVTGVIDENGQLPNAKATIYTCPVGKVALVTSVTLVNTGAVLTCNLYYKASGGTSRRIVPKDLNLAANGKHAYDEVLTMQAGDELEWDASVAAQVDGKVNGIEATL